MGGDLRAKALIRILQITNHDGQLHGRPTNILSYIQLLLEDISKPSKGLPSGEKRRDIAIFLFSEILFICPIDYMGTKILADFLHLCHYELNPLGALVPGAAGYTLICHRRQIEFAVGELGLVGH